MKFDGLFARAYANGRNISANTIKIGNAKPFYIRINLSSSLITGGDAKTRRTNVFSAFQFNEF